MRWWRRSADHKLFIRSVIILISLKSHRFPFHLWHEIRRLRKIASESWIPSPVTYKNWAFSSVSLALSLSLSISKNEAKHWEKKISQFQRIWECLWNDESINYNLTIVKQTSCSNGCLQSHLHWLISCSLFNTKFFRAMFVLLKRWNRTW